MYNYVAELWGERKKRERGRLATDLAQSQSVPAKKKKLLLYRQTNNKDVLNNYQLQTEQCRE